MSKYTIEDTSLTAIADAVRNKNHSASQMTPAEIKTAIDNLDVEEDYEWRKPNDWPDLESIQLPGSWDESTLYFLYDKKCGIDEVSIHANNDFVVHKGTVESQEFIGEQVYSAAGNTTYTDSLTEEYTVYKVVSSKATQISFGNASRITTSYPWHDEGCVWIYGEIPILTDVGGAPGSSILTPYLKRLNFSHVRSMYFTFPDNGEKNNGVISTSVSYVCGYEEPNDWGNLPVSRTGNGPITPPIKQKSDFVVKNVNFQSSSQCPITARNVVLISPSGTIRNQQYQLAHFLEKFICRDGTLKCTSMYYQFSEAYRLKICDLSGIDFSEATQSANAFSQCQSLEYLKLNNTWKMDLSLANSPNLTREAILGLFNDLPEITESKKITLNAYAKHNAGITDEELAIATNKGWTVA